MDGEAWWATVHGLTKSWTLLSDFTFFHFFFLWNVNSLRSENEAGNAGPSGLKVQRNFGGGR